MAAEQAPGYRHPAFTRAPKPKPPRVCIGYPDVDGVHVPCRHQALMTHNRQKRCYGCGHMNERTRMTLRNREYRAREPVGVVNSECVGHDTVEGQSVSCPKGARVTSYRATRCKSCAGMQRTVDSKLQSRASKQIQEARGVTKRLVWEPPHRPARYCEECCGISDRRPTEGLCRCGLPWAEEKIEDTRSLLHSNASGEFSRSRSR